MGILGGKLYLFAIAVKRHSSINRTSEQPTMAVDAIVGHRLAGAQQRLSPHYDARPDADDISLLVIHCISLPEGSYASPYVEQLFMGTLDTSADSEFAYLDGVRVSAHLVIRRDGLIEQYVPFDQRAWHAGKSSFGGRTRCNDFSIGIELEGTDQDRYTDAQYQQLAATTDALLNHYPRLRRNRIVGHQDIAPGRKTDPGQGFDWQRYLHLLTAPQETL